MRCTYFLLLFVFLLSCGQEKGVALLPDILDGVPSIKGKSEYLDSPFVTAGDRVYMVGHQDGSFPEIGWHIQGEMGGIWNHPIKLLDGFSASLHFESDSITLNKAVSFRNFPMANSHLFEVPDKELKVVRWQFVPDHKEGIAIQFIITNKGAESRDFNFRFTGYSELMPTWLGEETGMVDGPDGVTYDSGRLQV